MLKSIPLTNTKGETQNQTQQVSCQKDLQKSTLSPYRYTRQNRFQSTPHQKFGNRFQSDLEMLVLPPK